MARKKAKKVAKRVKAKAAEARSGVTMAKAAGKAGFSPVKLYTSRKAIRRMNLSPEEYGGIEMRIEEWTPERMRAELDRYGGKNRRIVKANVAKLVADMLSGAYKEDLRIKLVFDRDGNLIDGQHTLLAGVEARVTLLLVSLRGVPSHIQNVIDTGARRMAAQQNEIKDALAGKKKGVWRPITQIAKALHAAEGEAISETSLSDYVSENEQLLREIVKLSGDPEGPNYQAVRLAPIRAAFYSYAYYGGRKELTLVRRIMRNLREVSYRKGAAAKMLSAVVTPGYRTTNQSGSRSIKVLFPLAAATILAEEDRMNIRSVAELERLAANPATMVRFMKPGRERRAARRAVQRATKSI